MKLEPDHFERRLWLIDFVPDSDRFEWNAKNSQKNKKPVITKEEVESLFHRPYVFAGHIIEPASTEWRGLIFGKTKKGRKLALLFTKDGEKIRPIAYRTMKPEESKLYDKNL